MPPATMFPTSVYLRCPVTHDNSPDRDTFPNKNGMHKGIGRGGGTPCLVHLSDQTAKFKAFNVNEMNAISVIVAECEFVCIQKIVDFPLGVSCFGTCKASKQDVKKRWLTRKARPLPRLLVLDFVASYFFGLAEARPPKDESRAISASCLCASSTSAGCIAKLRYCCMCCDAPE